MKKLLLVMVSALILISGCIYLPAAGQPGGSTQVAIQQPVISSFGASPSSIQPGGVSTLSWSVTGATSVGLDNGIGNVAVNGTRAVTPAASTVYVLTASNSAGSATATTQVIVSGSSTPSTPPSGAGMPVINSFSASPNSITAGGTSTLSWSVSNASSINIQPGIGNVPANGSATISPGSSMVFALTASNSYGTVTSGTQVLVGSAPSPLPFPLPLPLPLPLLTAVYDFVARAPTAHWYSSGSSTIDLPFPGVDTDNRGFVLWRNNVTLEDNNVYTQVLETHPQWVTGGAIGGTYTEMASTYTVQPSDHFYSQVGFMKGASAGDVKYRIMIRTDTGNVWIADVLKTYSGALRTIDIPLSAYAGKKADFILEVDANNPNAAQDWAVWVNARITR